MLRFAWTAALSFSPAPLRVSFAFAVLVSAVGMAEAAYAVVRKLCGLPVEPGWTSLLIVVCLIGAGILLSIGVLGEYVARIFEQVKGRPLYVVSVTSHNLRPLDDRAAGVSVVEDAARLRAGARARLPCVARPVRVDSPHGRTRGWTVARRTHGTSASRTARPTTRPGHACPGRTTRRLLARSRHRLGDRRRRRDASRTGRDVGRVTRAKLRRPGGDRPEIETSMPRDDGQGPPRSRLSA